MLSSIVSQRHSLITGNKEVKVKTFSKDLRKLLPKIWWLPFFGTRCIDIMKLELKCNWSSLVLGRRCGVLTIGHCVIVIRLSF